MKDKEKGPTRAAEPRKQYAALPFRLKPQREVMLVSSRETKRWVLPKGWPMKGLKPHAAAAQEALEEAGIVGKVEKKPVGTYQYIKKMRNGAGLLCQVDVYPLEVQRQRKNWREREERITRWFPIDQAADAVREPELARLIRAFVDEQNSKAEPAKPAPESKVA